MPATNKAVSLFNKSVDHRDALEKRDTQKAQFHDLLAVFNPHQGGDPSLRSSTDDPGFVAAITQDSAGPEDDDEGDGDWDARDEDDGGDGGCLEGPRSLRPSPTLFLASLSLLSRYKSGCHSIYSSRPSCSRSGGPPISSCGNGG